MKTIQITMDEALLLKVNQAAHLKKVSRSQFIRQSSEKTLRQMAIEALEQKQADGYRRQSVLAGEFDVGLLNNTNNEVSIYKPSTHWRRYEQEYFKSSWQTSG